MCERCESSEGSAACGGPTRLKLWTLPRHYHCPVIGTCLSMAELRKVQRRCSLRLPPDASDHQLHTLLVGLAEQSVPATRRLHKVLERKYQRWISAYGDSLQRGESQRFWSEALGRGEVAGPLWAILSHSGSPRQLCDQALGDVHMLSHLQGASNRADLQRCATLEGRLAELERQLELSQHDHHQRMAAKARELAERGRELERLRSRLRAPCHSEQALTDALEESRSAAAVLTKRLDWAEDQLAQREHRLTELEHGHQGLIEQLRESQQERDALESALSQQLAQQEGDKTTAPGEVIDLGGKRLAYIGGRAALYPRLRAYVAGLNGRLTHHDGGLEDNRADLCSGLVGADLVFCPVDCVSHDACLRVKRFCKQHNKPFVLLRSASLSAFSSGLQAVSRCPGDGSASTLATLN